MRPALRDCRLQASKGTVGSGINACVGAFLVSYKGAEEYLLSCPVRLRIWCPTLALKSLDLKVSKLVFFLIIFYTIDLLWCENKESPIKGEGVALGATAPPTDGSDTGGMGEANIDKWLLCNEDDNPILGVVGRGARLGDDRCGAVLTILPFDAEL